MQQEAEQLSHEAQQTEQVNLPRDMSLIFQAASGRLYPCINYAKPGKPSYQRMQSMMYFLEIP